MGQIDKKTVISQKLKWVKARSLYYADELFRVVMRLIHADGSGGFLGGEPGAVPFSGLSIYYYLVPVPVWGPQGGLPGSPLGGIHGGDPRGGSPGDPAGGPLEL